MLWKTAKMNTTKRERREGGRDVESNGGREGGMEGG